MDAFTSAEGDYFNPLRNPIKPLAATTPEKKQAPGDSQESQTTETQPQETTNEGATPPATTSEAAPSQPTGGEASNSQPTGGGSASATGSTATTAETAESSAQGPKAKSAALPPSVSKPIQTLGRRRKPISQPPQETAEEKEKREEQERVANEAAAKHAAELIDQEQCEKAKLSEGEAKSKQAAASNTERAREASEKAQKAKEDAKPADPPSKAALRRMKKVPDEDDEDPPDKDQTPWQIYTYKPPPKAKGVYSYEGHSITNKMTAIDPQMVVNKKATVFAKGTNVKPTDAVIFLQKRPAYAGAKHRIRDIRSVQIERAFANKVSLFPPGHTCNTKDGLSVLIRVSAPYSADGDLLMNTLPGTKPMRYTLTKSLIIPHMKMEADFKDNRPHQLTHCALHFAARALGYKIKEQKVDDRSEWFTPEVLRAARVFIKEVSSGQYTSEDHTEVEKPAFVYHPSIITNHPEEAGKGRFVNLVSVGLQSAQVKWMSTKQLPFYVRGLLRAVPTGLLPEVFAVATITNPDIEVLVDQHLLV